MASNIVARIDDVIHVDDMTKHCDQFSCLSKVGVITQNGISVPYSVPIPNIPYKSAFSTPTFPPAQGIISPAKGEESPFINSSSLPQQGVGVNKVSTNFLSIDRKGKEYGSPLEKLVPTFKTFDEVPPLKTNVDSIDCTEEDVKLKLLDQAWLD